MELNIGLDISVAKQTAHHLGLILADTYLLYVKTQNFYWNLQDAKLYALHLFFEKQYKELAHRLDEIAERICMLGEKTPCTLKQFLKMSSICESQANGFVNDILSELMKDHETICRYLREQIGLVFQLRDITTADLLTKHLAFHEKSALRLRAQV